MKHFKGILMILGIVAILGLGIGVKAFHPQGPHGHPGPPPGGPEAMILEQLNLTDAQKAQIKSIHDTAHGDSKPYFDQMATLHEEMMAAATSATFDEAAARTLATKKAQIDVELTVIELRAHNAVYNILTSDQKASVKAKLEEMRNNQRGPMEGGFHHHLP